MGSVQSSRERELANIAGCLTAAQEHLQEAAVLVAAMMVPIVAPGVAIQGPSPTFKYDAEIKAAALMTGMDPIILAGLIQAESGFKPDKPGKSGERGLCQIMPDAWSDAMEEPYSRAWEPALNILAGARYWMRQRRWLTRAPYNQTDTMWAFVAYNSGPGNTQSWLEEGKALGQLSKLSKKNQARYRAGIAWARAQ